MQYALLERQNLAPRERVDIYIDIDLPTLQGLLPEGQQWAIDLETNGLDASDPNTHAVGIGLANDDHCLYLDLQSMRSECKDWLIGWLLRQEFVAFNVLFDSAFLWKLTGQWLNFVGCAFAMFKNLSSEGHPGQNWKLETAQLHVLGWPTSNKGVLEAALAERGLTKGEMYLLDPSILGLYCGLDADSTWQLWKVLCDVCARKLPSERLSA